MEQKQISALVEENMKTIFAYSLSRVSHKEDAEDLAGDIILAILQSAPRIRDDNAFFGYIWGIAANTYKKYLRRKSRVLFEEPGEELPAEDDFTREILKAEEHNALRRELALLSREYRECTIAYYFDGLSCAETASRLHISLEMVKYYLFKTRKILKEGIVMEREFGAKSYHPAKFEFHVIYTEKCNWEYQNLFNRKLPGNILVSAYHTPMTIRELAIELGVASVFLEDEIALLEKYRLLTALQGGKYQTNLIIFTEDYVNEFIRTVEDACTADIGVILSHAKLKLPEIRRLGFLGSDGDDNSLLWPLLYEMMRNGHERFHAEHKDSFPPDKIYGNATGTVYGSCYTLPDDSEYACSNFAGYGEISKDYAVSYADFGILPKKNRLITNEEEVRKNLSGVLAGEIPPFAPIVSQEEKAAIGQILQPEAEEFGKLYEALYEHAVKIMQTHAPENVTPVVGRVMANCLFFETVGLMGVCAVKSGELTVPENSLPCSVLIYRKDS